MVVVLDPPQATLRLLRDSLPPPTEDGLDDKKSPPDDGGGGDGVGPTSPSSRSADSTTDDAIEVLSYVASLASSLVGQSDFDPAVWTESLSPYLATLPRLKYEDEPTVTEEAVERFRVACERAAAGDGDETEDEEDGFGGEELCNIRFSLAYGGKILLHQTKLRLRRGHIYALVGQNGAGKTTLMTAINNGKLEGWPTHLRTHYVDSGSNVDPAHEAKEVFVHLTNSTGRSPEDCHSVLDTLDFTKEMRDGTIGELSGGWQMKLRLAEAVLVDADILLLDEPTNHLDFGTVDWLVEYLGGLRDTTVVCVSHDTRFMETICTDVIHYEHRESWGPHRKLVHYRGKMSEFVRKQPQAKHYFELATTDLKFKFPDPGRLEGIRTSTQKFLEMENVDYRYPGNDRNTLTGVNLKMSLSSRVVVLGANGAGKTTLVRMIVGDSQPTNLGRCKLFIHHNLRVAYVSQHAFFHVEQHIDDSPASYIQWRFKDGYDREKIESEAFRISPEEQKAIDDFGLEAIWSRRLRAGVLEYEVKKVNVREKDNKYYSKQELLGMGFVGLIKQADEKIAAKEAGLDLRPCTTTEIQRHLDNFGLEKEFGTYGKVRGLSGGQKVKLVLAAAMWNCPHLLVLDEPTNYLDREALGALSKALNDWGGSVLMISHNREFYGSVCKEEWDVRDGRVYVKGVSDEREMKAVARKKKVEKELAAEQVKEKAGGNVNTDGDKYKDATTNFWGQSVSKKELRQYEKAKKKRDVPAMRKILQIPMGKVMPGHEQLGDGKTVPN